MSLLEEVCTDLPGRNLRSQGQDRRAAPMSVEQTLDQVGIAWAATAGAHGQAASELGFGSRGEGPGLLVADMYPFDSVGTSDRVHDRVEAISDDAVDALDPGLPEHLYELLCQSGHTRIFQVITTKSIGRGAASGMRHRAEPGWDLWPMARLIRWTVDSMPLTQPDSD